MDADALSELELTLQAELERRSTFLELEELHAVARVLQELGGLQGQVAQAVRTGVAGGPTRMRPRHVRRAPLCVYLGDPRIAVCAAATANFLRDRHAEDCAIKQVPFTDQAAIAASLFGRVIGFSVVTEALEEPGDLHPGLSVFLETDGVGLSQRATFPVRDCAHRVFDALRSRDEDELGDLYHQMLCTALLCDRYISDRRAQMSCSRVPPMGITWARSCFRTAGRPAEFDIPG